MFGAAIFLGAGMMMLGDQVSEWWKIFPLVTVFAAAAVFLVRSVAEYRVARVEAASPEQDSDV